MQYRFSHDLDYLADLCRNAGLELPRDLGEIERLTPFAAAGRYGAPSPPLVERDTALLWATAALDWARTLAE